MKGRLQREIVKLAGLYKAAGMDIDEPLIKRHRKLHSDELEAVARILNKAAEIQQRGPEPVEPMKHSSFTSFELVAALQRKRITSNRTAESEKAPGQATNQALQSCPICGMEVVIAALEEHIRDELLSPNKDGKVRVTVDAAFGCAQREIYVAASKGREVKERVFEELGISVARQLLATNGCVVADKDHVTGSTVSLKYKKHYD